MVMERLYEIKPDGEVSMPRNAEITGVEMDSLGIYILAKTDIDENTIKRRFCLVIGDSIKIPRSKMREVVEGVFIKHRGEVRLSGTLFEIM